MSNKKVSFIRISAVSAVVIGGKVTRYSINTNCEIHYIEKQLGENDQMLIPDFYFKNIKSMMKNEKYNKKVHETLEFQEMNLKDIMIIFRNGNPVSFL